LCRSRGDSAGVQPRCAAAGHVADERALDPVALVDLDQVLADGRVLVLDQTAGDHRGQALAAGDADPRALVEPGGEALPGEGREQADAGDTAGLLHDLPPERTGLR